MSMKPDKKAKVIAASVIGGVLGAAMAIFLHYTASMSAAIALIPLGVIMGAAQVYMMPEKD